MIVVWLFLTLPFVIVLFPDHTHLLFLLYLLGVRVWHFVLNAYIESFLVWHTLTEIKGAECFAYCILIIERIPYLSVFQCPCLLETCVCLGLWQFLVIYTCFNPKRVNLC